MLFCGLEKNGMVGACHGHGMSVAWHGKCESDRPHCVNKNEKDTFYTLSGTAWQRNGTGAAWARHAMCESAFKRIIGINVLYEIS
jgi:hypothetical protein